MRILTIDRLQFLSFSDVIQLFQPTTTSVYVFLSSHWTQLYDKKKPTKPVFWTRLESPNCELHFLNCINASTDNALFFIDTSHPLGQKLFNLHMRLPPDRL